MKIIDDRENGAARHRSRIQARNVYLGVLLMVVGLLWLLNNFDLLGSRFFDIVFSWQVLLVLIGGYLCAVKRYWAGAVVAGIGIVFGLTDFFDVCVPVREVVLPVAVIAVGSGILVSAVRRNGN